MLFLVMFVACGVTPHHAYNGPEIDTSSLAEIGTNSDRIYVVSTPALLQ